MSRVVQRIRDEWNKLRGREPPPLRELPDKNMAKLYEREETFYVIYIMALMALLVVWFVLSPDLVDWLLYLFPSIGPIPATWIVNISLGLGLLVCGLGIRQVKVNYERKLDQRAHAYPWMTGTYTELTEGGYTTRYFQIAIEDVRELASSGDEVQLWGNPGCMTLGVDDHIYLVTQAYVPEDDLMRQFVVVTNQTLDEHLALKRFEDVFVGLLSVNVQVAKVNFVVPQRIQDQKPIMYVTHSAVTVNQTLNKDPTKIVDDDEIYAAERLYALTTGERYQQKSVQDRARIKELEEQNVRLQRHLVDAENRSDEEESLILTPEKEKVPILNLTGWKMYVFYAVIVFLIIGCVWGVGSVFGLW
jgi:hypothetical protein